MDAAVRAALSAAAARISGWRGRTPTAVRIGIGVALGALAYLVRAAMTGADGSATPFLLTGPAVVAAAALLGFSPAAAVLATSLSLAACNIQPVGSLWVDDPVLRQAFLVYSTATLGVAWAVSSLSRARTRAEALAAERDRALHEAERLLRERDAALDDAGRLLRERDAALREAERLLAELWHRGGNERLRVQALVEVHASHAARGGAPPEAKNALQRLVERLRAMTRVQSLLGARSGGPEAPVAIEGFLCALADGLAPLHHLPPGTLRCDVQPGVSLPYATAVPLGELVAELVGKACRYAYPADGNRLGPIRVACRREGQECVLVVEDEGVGMPAGHEAEGVGERLTRSLARQLGAARGVTWEPGPGGRGTRRLLRFPVPPETRGTLDIRELRAGGCGCPEGHGRPAPA